MHKDTIVPNLEKESIGHLKHIQTPSTIQKDTLWICANSKRISKNTIKIDNILQPVRSLLLDKIFE